MNNIPKEIIEFIDRKEEKIIFRNNELRKYLCQKCLCELTTDFKCKNCKKDYNFDNFTNLINHIALKKGDKYENVALYSYFDVIDNKAILYGLKSKTTFIKNKKNRTLSFDYIYEIRKDGVYDCIKNAYVYNDIDREYIYIRHINKNIFMKSVILYLDNLDVLKNTLYKNTGIWLDKYYLKENNFQNLKLLNIIYAPIFYKNYQYLKELNLKGLAYLKGFYEIDDTILIEKKDIIDHIEFMKKNDIDYPHYKALKEVNNENMDVLNKYIEKLLFN